MKIKELQIFLLCFLWLFAQQGLAQCGPDSTEVTINILTDEYFGETSWTLDGINETYAFIQEGDLTVRDSLYSWVYCLPDNDCISFTIFDDFGDGILTPGFYNVEVDEVEVAFGTGFGSSATSTLICEPGQNCDNGILAELDSIYMAEANDTYFEFTADTTGRFSISTCDLNDCDTKIWVYGECPTNLPPDSNEGTIFYNDNGNECDLQAQVNALLNAGTTIYIRIGSADNDCTENINWEITYNGPVMGCTDPTSCNYNAVATFDDGSCIPQGDPACPAGPDLEIQEDVVRNSLYLDQIFADEENCLIEEGCLQGYGTRDIIRFTTHFKNIGEFDYYIGPKTPDNDQINFDNCHNHPHYENYAEYLLADSFSNIIPIGHKTGFCVLDLNCNDGVEEQYGCDNMGITAGCEDVYSSGLDCQWIDVTDVADGAYTIVVRVNWLNQPDFNGQVESRIDNNWATACIILDRSSGVLEMEVETECAPYTDCTGTPFGLAMVDCEGTCAGTAQHGDLDQNEAQEVEDAEAYVSNILGNDITPTPCNDLNGDGRISVYDAALINDCVNYASGHIHTGGVAHEHCDFPTGLLNPNDTITLSIIDHHPAEDYVDIGMVNTTSRVVAYEFSISGIMMTNVESLTDATTEPFTVQGNFNGEIIGISYPDSSVERSLLPQPLCRVYYQSVIETEICISEIRDIINSDYEQTIPRIGGECIFLTSTKEFTNDLEIRVQPNPFSMQTDLVIQYPDNIEFDLNILDVNGRVVQEYGKVRPGTVTIERGDLGAGIYFFELTSGATRKVGRLSVF